MGVPKDPFKFEEWRRKLSKAKRGHIVSDETREKMRDANLGRGLGRIVSEETREKLRDVNLGRVVSEETREKLRSAQLGKHHLEETREKMRGTRGTNAREPNPMFGKVLSKETRIKQSCAKQGISISEFDGFKRAEFYCELWNGEFRERVLGFFGYVCMYPGCGKTQEEEGRRLSVHHVNYDKQTCCRENEEVSSRKFVTLCNRHNLAVNYDRELWERYFIDLINNEYEGRCYFTKEEWAWLNGVMWWRYENNF